MTLFDEHQDVRYGFHLVFRDTVKSTNDEAHHLARAGMLDKTCVWARHQTAGRGRRGRHWSSPTGNLYCSLLIHHEDLVALHAVQLSFIAALAVGDVISQFLPPRDHYWFKWPNDILINNYKVAGILLETEIYNRISYTIIGIGVNIFSAPMILDSTYPATALVWHTKKTLTIKPILTCLLHRFAYWYSIWIKEGFSPVRTRWIRHALGWGQRLTVQVDDITTVQGWFQTVGDDGSLGLHSLEDQTMHWIRKGEVVFPIQESE